MVRRDWIRRRAVGWSPVRLDPEAVGSAVTALTLTVAFGLLALGVDAFWVAFPVGFGGVLPLAVSLAATDDADSDASETAAGAEGTDVTDAGTDVVDPSETETATSDPRDTKAALADLRRRYARGELTDDAFERRVEELLAGDEDDGPRRQREVRERERAVGDPNA
jgi:hypothetical protein